MLRKFRITSVFIALLMVSALAAGASAAVNRTAPYLALKDVYADYFRIGSLLGTAANFGTTQPGDTSVNGLRLKHFNAFTPENTTKPQTFWPNTLNDLTATNKSNAQAIARAARLYNPNYYINGHALFWHNTSDGWPIGTYGNGTSNWSNNTWDYEQAKYQVERYVKQVVETFNGEDVRFNAWDVGNEPMKDNPSEPTDWRNALRTHLNPEERSSRWALAYSKGGNPWDYVYDFFYFARKYTQAHLVYNDFNDLENEKKAIAIASMVKEFNATYAAQHPEDPRKLVEVIASQGHYNMRLNLDNLDRNIKMYLDIPGVRFEMSEFDIAIPMLVDRNPPVATSPTTNGSGVLLTAAADRAVLEGLFVDQAIMQAKLMLIWKKYAHYNEGVTRINWWGIGDGIWNSTGYPGLWFDTRATQFGKTAYAPKEAFFAAAQPEEYLEELDMTPGGPATFTYDGRSFEASTWGGAYSFAQIDVSVPAGTRRVDFSADNVTLPAGFILNEITFSPANGAVGGGKPCLVTVKTVSETNPKNSATYKLTFAWDEDSTKTGKAWRLANSIQSGKTYMIVSAESETEDPETGTKTAMALTNRYKNWVANVTPAGLSRTPVTVMGDTLVFDHPNKEQENLKFHFEERSKHHPSPGQYESQAGYTIQSLVHGTNVYPQVVFRGQNRTGQNGYMTNGQRQLITRGNGDDPPVADVVLDQAIWFNTGVDPDTGETQMFLYTYKNYHDANPTDKHYALKEVEQGAPQRNRDSMLNTTPGGFVVQQTDDPIADGTRVRLYEYAIEPYNVLVLKGVDVFASVEKLNGNKNNLTITIVEDYDDGADGEIVEYEETFSINNNAAGTYQVGPYKVYVDTKGNTQIRACYIVE